MSVEIKKIEEVNGKLYAFTTVTDDCDEIDRIFSENPKVDVVITEPVEYMERHIFAYRPVWFAGEYTVNFRRRKTDVCCQGQDKKNHHYSYEDE